MISDVLYDTEKLIEEYLEEMPNVYRDDREATIRIKKLLEEMRAIRMLLGMDTPPE